MQSEVLWTVFGYIDSHWDVNTEMSKTRFEQALASQVGLDPVYQLRYDETAAAYQAELEQHGNIEAALEALYSKNTAPKPAQPDVAQVLGEFMKWNVAFGGFRSFGYMNYPGWTGNGSFLNDPPPYRALP
ncbi:MAG: hypothetical protein ETSY1_21980 [Candidatus Entotheonella factor]|uniref:Uncharacterized protein n=1 Tax=Entotheonella factor TaxID=1429438 RepID=W4LHY8_ENTF1|nr:hypothetical protein [Candidatus Entotheonella palauensis]ETW97597.1 MAG: hypothetical protein ETSY1_21980 [Candidatus Entotheonella factor]